MLIYHLFQFALGLFMLAISALSVPACLWHLRSPQPQIRWWLPATVGLLMLAMGMGRVSAAFDPVYHISVRTLVLMWAAASVGLVAFPFFLVSLVRSRRAKSSGATPPAA